jgi:hypothetical protein
MGTFAFNVGAAGQNVDLGVVQLQTVESQDAVLRGRVLFDGAPFEPIGDPCGLIVSVWGYEYERPIDPDGSFDFSVPVKNEMGHGYVGTAMMGEGAYFGEQSLPLVGGLVTERDIDITATAGVVEGVITVNGEPVQAHVSVPGVAISGACFLSDAKGAFRAVLPPGTHTLHFGSLNTALATRIVTVTAGTASLLDVDVPCPDGGQVCVSGFWMGALNGFGQCSLMLLQVSGGSVSGSASCARSHGTASGTFDSATQRLLLTMSVSGAPQVSIDAFLTLSPGHLSGTWSGQSSGSVELARTPQQAITYIGAASGGDLTTSLGDALDVPPAALADDALIEASVVTLPEAAPAGFGALPYAYDFGPDGLAFSAPAQLTAAFDGAMLLAEGLDPSQLSAYVLEGDTWQPVPSFVDSGAGVLTASLEHFSTYALMAPQLASTATPTPSLTETPTPSVTQTPSATPTPAPSQTATAPTPPVLATEPPALPSQDDANSEGTPADGEATQPAPGPPPPSGVTPASDAGGAPASIGIANAGTNDMGAARLAALIGVFTVFTAAGLTLVVAGRVLR